MNIALVCYVLFCVVVFGFDALVKLQWLTVGGKYPERTARGLAVDIVSNVLFMLVGACLCVWWAAR